MFKNVILISLIVIIIIINALLEAIGQKDKEEIY